MVTIQTRNDIIGETQIPQHIWEVGSMVVMVNGYPQGLVIQSTSNGL